MIAVLGSRLDPEARSLVEAWSSAGAALLSAEDLCRPGWVFRPREPLCGTAVVSGAAVAAANLEAVLTRRPAVLSEELRHIATEDRSYVAAETNAFLVAWLSALVDAGVPVVNRPTPTCLSGPGWDALRWRAAAARVGAEWAERAGTEESCSAELPHEVVVCGERCFFARRDREANVARALSQQAGTQLLGVRFRSGRVFGVTAAPALVDDEVRGALLSLLRRSGGAP